MVTAPEGKLWALRAI